MKHASLLFNSSWREIFRNPAHIFGLLLFSACLLIMFPFAFGIELTRDPMVRSGVFWMIQEFSVALFLGQLFTKESQTGMLDFLISAKVSKKSLALGKVLFSTLFLFILQIPMILMWILFFNLSMIDVVSVLPQLLSLCLLFNLGSSSAGALLSAATYKAQAREVLFPIIFFPLQSALLTCAVMLTLRSFPQTTLVPMSNDGLWMVLGIYPVIFIALAVVLEDALF